MNKIPPRSICKNAFSYSNLTILVPQLSYIIGIKLDRGRDRYRQDSREIIKLVEIRSIKDIINKLNEYRFQPDI